jgi:hypothetical protein
MSWNSGSQPTQRISPPCPNISRIIALFATRFSWLSITPFGELVEPDVYCSSAIDSAEEPAGANERGAGGSAST